MSPSRYDFSGLETNFAIFNLFQETVKTAVDLPKPTPPSSAPSKPEPKTVVLTQTMDVKTINEMSTTKSINDLLNQEKLKKITNLSLTVSTEVPESQRRYKNFNRHSNVEVALKMG